MNRLLCLLGRHSGWTEFFRAKPDSLGISTVYERCVCGSRHREVWDFRDGTRRVM